MSEIDVSKCKFFDEEYCSISKHSYVYCCQKEDCYYKQLQHRKIENEKLKEKLENIKEIANVIVYGTHFTNDIEGYLKELVKDVLEIIESEN